MLRILGSITREVIYRDASFNAGTSSSYTFSSMAFGKALAKRMIIVCAGASTQLDAISTVTIAGTAATQAVKGTNGLINLGIWYRVVGTGTAGDVVVNTTGNAVNCFAATLAAYGISSSTPHDTGIDMEDNPASVSVDIPANGIAVGVSFGDSNSTGGTTWVGLTEDYDQPGDGGIYQSVASGSEMAAETGRTISAQAGNGFDMNMVAASWG